MQEPRPRSVTQRWPLLLALLLVSSLAGCGSPPPTLTQSPTATATLEPTLTQTPTVTPEPTPIPSPPEPGKPVIDPAGEITMEVGKTIAVRANATGAKRYEWGLQGNGLISATTGDVILYTTPAEGGGIGIVTVTAYNDQGASLPTSLVINVLPIEGVEETRQPLQSVGHNVADMLSRLCWIAYSPTHFDPTTSPIQWPSEEDVREDLFVLRSAGFNGLVTYGSNYTSRDTPGQMLDIPRLAQEAGFEGMIVGVWDPTDENELQAAEQAGLYPIVVGYSVGNEGLDARYDLETLVSAMDRLRQTTGKPASTTEQVHDYYGNSPLWTISDWIFPNAHPYFAGYRDPQEAVEWTERIFETLALVSDKPLIVKEVGLPSGGDTDVNEARQAQYYQLLRETNVTYVIFEAFDAPWKHLTQPRPDGTYPLPDPEPHWGIFSSDRIPKEAAANICPVR